MITSFLNFQIAAQLGFTNPTQISVTPLPPTVNEQPIKKNNSVAPVIGASSFLSIDLETNKILSAFNPDQKLPMASLTKLMTVLIVLEENNLDEIVKVTKEGANVEGTQINVNENEEFRLENLVKAAIISSGNDATQVLAIHNAGSLENFTKKMNSKAKALGMQSTNFKNSTGLDEIDHYSTASDLAILAKATYSNQFIKDTSKIKEITIKNLKGKEYKLKNTNDLLDGYLNVLGLKTGTTELAGQCLITIVEQNGNTILNIMLNSPSRFKETKILSQWVFDSFVWL